MNSQERMARAMRHKIPDRVPVMCQLALGHYFLNVDHLQPHEIWFTSEGFAEALVQMQRRYRFDGILVNLPGRPRNLLSRISKREVTADGEWLTWDTGDKTFFPWDDNPHLHPAADSGPTRADFATINPADLDYLDQLKGYIWNTYHIPWLDDKTTPGPLAPLMRSRPKWATKSRCMVRSFRR
jgi:Uroporphyrinogen decarboxylase (URO-D)